MQISALSGVKSTNPTISQHYDTVLPLIVYMSRSFDIFCENLEIKDPSPGIPSLT